MKKIRHTLLVHVLPVTALLIILAVGMALVNETLT